MTTAKIVKDEAKALFAADQATANPRYRDIAEVIMSVCAKHDHPLFDEKNCLCAMFADTNEEVHMAAVLFLSSDPEIDFFAFDEEAFVIIAPDAGKDQLLDNVPPDEVLEAYGDQGAVKIMMTDLLKAYNKINKTKHSF